MNAAAPGPEEALGGLAGPRVVVVGTSCSGKTTWAQAMAEILGAGHLQLDALYWQKNWEPRPLEEFRSRIEREAEGERWVADGNYAMVRDLLWPRATDVVWLDYPLRLVFGRALSRTLRRALTREALYSGNRESFRTSFLSRDSILLWVLQTHRKNRGEFTALQRDARWAALRFHRFQRPREAEALLATARGDYRGGDRKAAP